MKRYLFIFCGFICAAAILGISYYLSFRNALLHYNQTAIEQNTELLNQLLQYSDKSKQMLEQIVNETTITEESMEASTVKQPVIQTDTLYILEISQLSNQTMTRNELPVPGFFIGLTRDELSAYINGYMEYLPINEYLDGMLSYEIISFSTDKVVLRKTYDASRIEYQYFICQTNGRVTIYYSDLKTVYEYTDILCSELSAEAQRMLQNGFYIKDVKELYGVLEGFTS